MPRIDPLQLLKCLSVLLTPEGGILSSFEVPRLVNLMTKFSKKLVSKCIYLLILKNTKMDLVDMFMGEGGWALIQTWLQDAIQIANWELVREILELLLVTPADVQRLKTNVLPKLIKNLSRREELGEVAELSSKLVQQWLSIVKKTQTPQSEQTETATAKTAPTDAGIVQETAEELKPLKIEYIDEEKANGALYKTTDKDGKIVIRKLSNNDMIAKSDMVDEKSEDKKQKERSRSSSSSGKDKYRDSDKDRKRSSSSSSKSKSGSSSSRSKDYDRKDRDRDKKYSSSHSSSRSSSSKSSSSRDKKDYRSKDKEKYKSDKERQEEKDQETLSKLKTPAIDKLGRIPKKSNPEDKDKSNSNQDSADIKKKFSVGIRKDSGKDERPKTVKVYNSKMRSTGLEEEVRPAPQRVSGKKPTPSLQLPTIPQKRPSPPRDVREPIPQPEKKLKIDKIDIPDRPGAIKLIPPKPKPAFLQESDIFSDALTAAIPKKEPKKRKRRPSIGGKEPTSPTSPPGGDQPQTPTSPSSATLGLKNIAPINFYQDTLAQEADEDDKENNEEESKEEEAREEGSSSPKTPTYDGKDDEPAEPTEAKRPKVTKGGLRGVLLYTKKRGPKKSISWKNEEDLVEIKYFELDETERVNVSRASFGDMAKMEMTSERETLHQMNNRKPGGDDTMETHITWRFPMEIEIPDSNIVPGSKSLEKDIQFAREKSTLQALYFDKRRIPDSAEEPIPENHQMVDPAIIPLEDPDSQDIDLRSTSWPEPKGQAPQPEAPPVQPMFPQPGPFPTPFGNMPVPPPSGYQSIPQRFPNPGPPMGGPPMGMGGPAFMPPNMMPNGSMMTAPPPDMMNMNPNMFPMPPDMGYPQFPNQLPPNMNMFPPNNHNFRPMGPDRGGRGGRGMFRPRGGDGGGGGWVRMNTNNWNKRGNMSMKLCKNVQNRGFCRNIETCMFMHP